MSLAFIDEDSEHQDELPDITQSHFPGYITPEGFERLQKELDDSLKKGGAKHSPNEGTWADKLKGFFSA